MFSAALKSGAAATPTDPQFNYVAMLLHGDGTNGGQNNTFLDSSTNNYSITRNGNTTQGSFSPYGSNWSNYFDGSSAYLSMAGSSAFAIATSTTPFTVEAWIYPTVAGQTIFTASYPSSGTVLPIVLSLSNGTSVDAISGLYPALGYYTGSAWVTAAMSTTAVALNTWTHVAAVFTGSTTKIFINGVDVTKASSPTPATTWGVTGNNGAGWFIGKIWDAAQYYTGYISNFRFVNGTAIYTSAFTPSTTPLTAVTNTKLLTCQSNRFVDNSASPLTITVNGSPSVQRFSPFAPSAAYSTATIGGSGYFDGSGDYLDVGTSTAFGLGTGDFTYEAWIYPTTVAGGAKGIIELRLNGQGPTMYLSGGTLNFWRGGTPDTSGVSVSANSWSHVAVTRQSGTLKFWINGVQASNTASVTDDFGTSNPARVGSTYYNEAFPGYISDARVVKGTAIYTANFTPSTAPLTAVSGTSLLLGMTNAAIFDNAMMNDLETVGNAQISTSVKKYGTGSLYMAAASANTDYFVTPATQNENFGTGNFTIEFWLNPNSITTSWANGSNATILDTDVSAGSGTDWWALHQVNGTLSFVSNSAVILTSSSALAATTWQHCAIVRSGSTLTMYVSGTSVGSTTYATTIGGNRRLFIGTQPGQSRWYQGYIDDLRITKGYARYTANFTPPTAAFPNQ